MREFIMRSVVIGAGATLIYDLWGRMLVLLFGLPGSNWTLAGRWFSYMTNGQFIHDNIAKAPALPGETAVGWTMHYFVGMVYAAVLIAIWGLDWARRPRLFPALVVGIATIAAGWLMMVPAMGFGIAGAKLPNVDTVRVVQFVGHVVFGLGLYLSARISSRVLKASG